MLVDLAAWRLNTIREGLRDHGADTALLKTDATKRVATHLGDAVPSGEIE